MPAASALRPAKGPLWEIVEETFDEAEFLWRRWQGVLWTHAYGLDGVSFWVEERLLGAIDGLHVAGESAVDSLLVPALGAEDRFRATVAAHVLATQGERRGVGAVIGAFLESEGDRLTALEHGLELVRNKSFFVALDQALVGVESQRLASALRMRAFQQRDPGPELGKCLESDDPELQAAALQSLRHTAAVSGAVAVESLLDASDPIVRDAAIETGLIRGIGAAWQRCRDLASSLPADCGRALLLVALLGLKKDHERVAAAMADEGLRSDALFALGFAGTRAAAEICIEAMAAESHAQLAAEAFSAITGLDLVTEKLTRPTPKVEREEPIPFEEEDLDASLVPAPADALPWPDVGGVIRWWNAHRNDFAEGQRYIGGRPVDLTALQGALLNGPMRRRHVAALELAVRTGGRYQVETRALTATQRRHMEAFELLGGEGIRRSRLSKLFSPA